MVVTYNDVLVLWTLKRDVEETRKQQDLELLTMRLRDAVRPDSLFMYINDVKDTSTHIPLFHTKCSDEMCQEACRIVNTTLPTWIRASSMYGKMYISSVDSVF